MSGEVFERTAQSDFDPALLDALMPIATSMHVARGDVVLRSGESTDALFVVLRGALDMHAGEEVLARRRQGEVLGALHIITGAPQFLTVVAAEDSDLLLVPAAALDRLTVEDPMTRRRLALAVRGRPSQHLENNPLFSAVSVAALARIDETAGWASLEAGEYLCREGDPADAIYVVVHGRLEVLVGEGDDERVLDQIGHDAIVGEMGLLEDQPRSATLRAVRDSELIVIPAAEFRHLIDEPQLLAALARTLASRLRHTSIARRQVRSARTIAVIPAGSGPMPDGFLSVFQAALSNEQGTVLCLRRGDAGAALAHLDQEGSGLLMSWLYDNETAFRFIILEGDGEATPWTVRAIRQADLILSVALSKDNPAPSPLERLIASDPALRRVRRELVLLHAPDTPLPQGTAAWLNGRAVKRHHHLRLGASADFARLARWVAGHSLGLVLSGGAARGFAHIGAMQALRDLGLQADFICGSSMGAIIGGQAALGWDIATMIARNKELFAQWRMMRNLTLPFVALQTGRNTVRLLRAVFGDAQIEDLWLPYFCVSTNLSRAEVAAHESGPAWLWTRASCSIPGILPPVVHAGDLLVDGGVLNNLPIDLMHQRCPGPIVAVDVSPVVEMTTAASDICTEMHGWPHLWRSLARRSGHGGFPNMMEILMRAATIGASSTSKRNQSEADLYLHPPVDAFTGFDWSAMERLIDIGYRHAYERIAAWQEQAVADEFANRSLPEIHHI